MDCLPIKVADSKSGCYFLSDVSSGAWLLAYLPVYLVFCEYMGPGFFKRDWVPFCSTGLASVSAQWSGLNFVANMLGFRTCFE